MSVEESIKSILEKIRDLKIAILFGSYAKGKQNSKSDIDLALCFSHKLDLDYLINLSAEISKMTGKEVDLVDLRSASGVLLQQILSNKITLINRDSELYGNILAKCVTEQSDFMPLYDMILKSKRDRFISG